MKSLGKRFYILSGVVFTLISLGLFSVSALFYLEPVQAVNFERVKSGAIKACAAKFDGQGTYMGMRTEVNGDSVYFTTYGLEEWEGKFNMASHAVSSCDGMSLQKFCFGESCNLSKLTGDDSRPQVHEGMFFELKFNKENIDPRIKVSSDWK